MTPSPKSIGKPTGVSWRRPSPPRRLSRQPHGQPALFDCGTIEGQALLPQVIVAASFVAVMGAGFFVALQRTFEFMP